MIFESRNAVIIWLCDKNLARGDIPFEYRRYFIGKKFLACYASANGYERDDELQYTSRYKNKKYMIASDVGSEYERSSITIMKYGRFVLAMDEIFRKDPVFAQKILTGEIKIPRESETVISQMSAEEIIMIREYLNEKGGNKITIPEKRRVQNLYRPKPVALENPGFRSIKPEIKNMPKYDPDAETMSLALTIPSWKSSIERVRDKADFAGTSEKARNKLLRQLSILSDTIEELSSYIEEAVNEHGNRNGP